MNRTTVELIKERLPIEDVIGGYIKLDKAGKSFKAKCPFHNEKTASFFISPERGGYYCFGCGAKGDIFTFVEQFEGIDFKGALKVLAERAGVLLVFDQKADSERDALFKVMEEATAYFETQYSKSKEAQDYIKGRGITDKTRVEFRVGWAPEGWSNLHNYLKAKKYPETLLEKAGLIKKAEKEQALRDTPSAPAGAASGSHSPSLAPKRPSEPASSSAFSRFYDRFRGRVMFPIMDSSGRVVAFSGRILKDDGKSAKYLNSPDTPLYDKSAVLYGLDKAKSEIRRMGYTILVEGQMDLVMSHQAGIKNSVATSGTAMTDESFNESGALTNLGLVKRLSQNVIIAFDSDSAGKKAAMRAAGIALSLGMEVKIADLVGGKDPADLVREDVELWKTALKTAKPVIEFELDNLLKEVTDKHKLPKAMESRIYPLLLKIETPSIRSEFVQLISSRTKMPVATVWDDIEVVSRRLKQTVDTKPGPTIHTSSERPRRIDLAERRLFGLIYLMQRDKIPELSGYRERLQVIAGDSYAERSARAEAVMSDLAFEAETFFGDDADKWKHHADELFLNFEEDIINEQLMSTMDELRQAERAGNQPLLAELAKMCQELSTRKAEVGKRRHN